MFMLCLPFFKVHSGHLYSISTQGLQLFVFCGFRQKTEENIPSFFPAGFFSYGFVAGGQMSGLVMALWWHLLYDETIRAKFP